MAHRPSLSFSSTNEGLRLGIPRDERGEDTSDFLDFGAFGARNFVGNESFLLSFFFFLMDNCNVISKKKNFLLVIPIKYRA